MCTRCRHCIFALSPMMSLGRKKSLKLRRVTKEKLPWSLWPIIIKFIRFQESFWTQFWAENDPDVGCYIRPDLGGYIRPDVVNNIRPDVALTSGGMYSYIRPNFESKALGSNIRPDITQIRSDMDHIRPDIIHIRPDLNHSKTFQISAWFFPFLTHFLLYQRKHY